MVVFMDADRVGDFLTPPRSPRPPRFPCSRPASPKTDRANPWRPTVYISCTGLGRTPRTAFAARCRSREPRVARPDHGSARGCTVSAEIPRPRHRYTQLKRLEIGHDVIDVCGINRVAMRSATAIRVKSFRHRFGAAGTHPRPARADADKRRHLPVSPRANVLQKIAREQGATMTFGAGRGLKHLGTAGNRIRVDRGATHGRQAIQPRQK